MNKKIGFYTVGGFYFSSMIKGEISYDQIFEDLLTGKNELIQVANMCFVKKNIAGIVIEDVEEPAPSGHGVLPDGTQASGESREAPSSEQFGGGCDQGVFAQVGEQCACQDSCGDCNPNAHA